MLDYPFELNVDLNRNKKLALSQKPENPVSSKP
jgi:hypothetical protein